MNKRIQIMLLCTLFAMLCLSSLAHAQKSWTWYIHSTNTVSGSPSYFDVTLGLKAASAGDAGKLGNFAVRGKMSPNLYDFDVGHDPVLQVNHLGSNYDVTLTNAVQNHDWQVNATVADGSGMQVTESGIQVVTLRFYQETQGELYISFSKLNETFEDDNTTAVNISYENNHVFLKTKIFLEGPYDENNDNMNTTLNSLGHLPLTSPYSEDPRTVSSIPGDIVDWILVELRETYNSSAICSKSTFLRNDGHVVDDDGITEQVLMQVSEGEYYIVIKHRNHLAVMSAESVFLSPNYSTLYDFSLNRNKYYPNYSYDYNIIVEIEDSVWGMWAGDINQDGQVTTMDYTDWYNSAKAGDSGYKITDINFDIQVTTMDYTDWYNNAKKGAASYVPPSN